MIPLLAQTTPPPAALSSWLEVLFYMIGGIASVVGLLVGLKTLNEKKVPLPQPLTVKEQRRFATYEELQAVQVELRGISARFDEAVALIRRDGEGRTAGIEQHIEDLQADIKADNQILHGRITELLAAFAEFRGECKGRTKC